MSFKLALPSELQRSSLLEGLRNCQIEALKTIENCYNNGKNSCYIEMCTGSGKTITFMKSIKLCNFKKTIIVFPTLSLLDQFNKDYVQKDDSLKVDFVCSQTDLKGTGLFYNTDLRGNHHNIVATTYASLGKVLEKDVVWDAIIFDEAHHEKTENCKEIQAKYSDKIKFSLYFSATFKEGQTPDFSYTLFHAIRDNVCKDFDIYTYIAVKGEEKTIIDYLIELGIKTNNKKMMLFTNYTNEKNCEDEDAEKNSVKKFLKDYGGECKRKGIWLNGIKGDDNPDKKQRTLKEFETNKGLSLLVSCRTIGEGIDINGVNAIVFLDPKRSIISITQNIGRGLRVYKDKDGNALPKDQQRNASIIVTTFVDKEKYMYASSKEEYDLIIREAMSSDGDFSTIFNLLTAIRQSDPEMYDILVTYPKINREKKEKIKRETKGEKTVIDIPRDGDCFFHCLSRSENDTVDNLRNRVVDYILENKDKYEDFLTDNSNIEKLREKGVYNNEEMDIAVIAASDMLNRELRIKEDGKDDIIINEGKGKPIEVYKDNMHYDLILPSNEETKTKEKLKATRAPKFHNTFSEGFRVMWKIDDDVDLETDFVGKLIYEIEDNTETRWNKRLEEADEFITREKKRPSSECKNDDKEKKTWSMVGPTNYTL